MPLLTRYAIRLALIYLVLGILTGALYWLNVIWPIWPPLNALNPTYIHLMVVGWITQLIYGVMYWMFPIISRDNMRGDARPAWAVLILLNIGLVLRTICEPLQTTYQLPLLQYGLLASSIFQAIAAYLMVVVCWPRIREKPGK